MKNKIEKDIEIADRYQELDKPLEAEKYLMDALTLTEKGNFPKLKAQILYRLAEINYQIELYDTAITNLDRALEIDDIKPSLKSRILLLQGKSLFQQFDLERAQRKYEDLFSLLKDSNIKEFQLVDMYYEYAQVLDAQRNFRKALENYKTTYTLYEKRDDKLGMAKVNIALAFSKRNQGLLKAASRYLDQAENMLNHIEENDDSLKLLAQLYCNRGALALEEGVNSEACSYYEEAISIFQLLNKEFSIRMAKRNIHFILLKQYLETRDRTIYPRAIQALGESRYINSLNKYVKSDIWQLWSMNYFLKDEFEVKTQPKYGFRASSYLDRSLNYLRKSAYLADRDGDSSGTAGIRSKLAKIFYNTGDLYSNRGFIQEALIQFVRSGDNSSLKRISKKEEYLFENRTEVKGFLDILLDEDSYVSQRSVLKVLSIISDYVPKERIGQVYERLRQSLKKEREIQVEAVQVLEGYEPRLSTDQKTTFNKETT